MSLSMNEIIDMIAEQYGMDKNYVSHISEKDIRVFYPSTIGHRFMTNSTVLQQSVKVAAAQHEMIRQLALGGDCAIVGRCADVLCWDMNPLNIFVYADRLSKLRRCETHADGRHGGRDCNRNFTDSRTAGYFNTLCIEKRKSSY